jgi:hypothetical protein
VRARNKIATGLTGSLAFEAASVLVDVWAKSYTWSVGDPHLPLVGALLG